jgi:hypothetical protein
MQQLMQLSLQLHTRMHCTTTHTQLMLFLPSILLLPSLLNELCTLNYTSQCCCFCVCQLPLQADYDPSVYDHQYVNFVSLTGTVQNVFADGAGGCNFLMLLNRNPDPAAGMPPVFDA